MHTDMNRSSLRKIIHIDMDCFYAAIEIRDNPQLANLPVAVGGSHESRGVLCTCNYIARKYGIHSAMPTITAKRLCPDLVVLPVNIVKYKQVSRQIQAIFCEYTDLVEPLSLDEAYLDVSNSQYYQGSATLIAENIRSQIWNSQKLTASAGVAPNKFLAKIASSWNKPNGIFVIRPEEVESFVAQLSVDKLFGVGKVTAAKLAGLNIQTCMDLQKFSLTELINRFGKLGNALYYQARGTDNRAVISNRQRKSLSVETTFASNIEDMNKAMQVLAELYVSFERRLLDARLSLPIKGLFVKIKFADFSQTSAEIGTKEANLSIFTQLFLRIISRCKKPIRLIGIGVNFKANKEFHIIQPELF